MKSKYIYTAFLIFLSLGIISCNNDDEGMPPSKSEKDFIWKSMNLWYYWQSQVENLGDNRFSSQSEYQNFLDNYSPNELFYNLLYDYGATDRFSWIVSDYHTLQNQFAGINKTFGMDYGLVQQNNSTDVFGYVQYVLPNSPASLAGLQRGDIFTRINGTQLNTSNYQTLLANETAHFRLAYFENGTLIETTNEATVTKVQMQENPVFLNTVFEIGGQKIGYLVYNGFRSNYNDELNQAIIQLKSQNITHLILDLRYNGGGSVQTAGYLGTMLTGQFNGQAFTHMRYNAKMSENNSTYKFESTAKLYDDQLNQIGSFPIESLNLNHLYVITTGNSASASEMLITCLDPFILVETFGTKTYGKTVGSITLYDSPSTYYTSDQNINPNHTIAMQPIVFEYKNSQNQSGPTFGIIPEVEVNEIHYLENLPDLGDLNEPLLAAALNSILGPIVPRKEMTTFHHTLLTSSQELKNFGTEMYLDKGVELKP
jgi:carboxyl-terminal processing protease